MAPYTKQYCERTARNWKYDGAKSDQGTTVFIRLRRIAYVARNQSIFGKAEVFGAYPKGYQEAVVN